MIGTRCIRVAYITEDIPRVYDVIRNVHFVGDETFLGDFSMQEKPKTEQLS